MTFFVVILKAFGFTGPFWCATILVAAELAVAFYAFLRFFRRGC